MPPCVCVSDVQLSNPEGMTISQFHCLSAALYAKGEEKIYRVKHYHWKIQLGTRMALQS